MLDGKPNGSLDKLEAAESKAQRRVEALVAAQAMAAQRLSEAEAQEKAVEQACLVERRSALRVEILALAGKVDAALGHLGRDLANMENLLAQHRGLGGRNTLPTLKSVMLRAVTRAGASAFLLERYLDAPQLCLALEEHLAKWLAEASPAAKKIA